MPAPSSQKNTGSIFLSGAVNTAQQAARYGRRSKGAAEAASLSNTTAPVLLAKTSPLAAGIDEQPVLSVVIPAYNEEKRLPHTLKAVIAYLQKQTYAWEVAVVDDGSRDRTADIVRETTIVEPRVKLLSYGQNHGKGYAVRYGMTHVQGKYRVFMDADNSTTLDHVEQMVPFFHMGYDIVIGSRDVAGANIAIHQPWWKEKLGDLGNLWIRFWAVRGIKDTQAGFKIFTDYAADAVFPYLTIDRWGFDVEALAVSRLRGYKIAERPIRWANDPDSKVSSRAYLDVLKEVVQVRLNMWQGKYKK